jgi:hypothetical protein
MWRGKPDASTAIVYMPGVGRDIGSVNGVSIRGNDFFERVGSLWTTVMWRLW